MNHAHAQNPALRGRREGGRGGALHTLAFIGCGLRVITVTHLQDLPQAGCSSAALIEQIYENFFFGKSIFLCFSLPNAQTKH